MLKPKRAPGSANATVDSFPSHDVKRVPQTIADETEAPEVT
jgi:hypothetical protein